VFEGNVERDELEALRATHCVTQAMLVEGRHRARVLLAAERRPRLRAVRGSLEDYYLGLMRGGIRRRSSRSRPELAGMPRARVRASRGRARDARAARASVFWVLVILLALTAWGLSTATSASPRAIRTPPARRPGSRRSSRSGSCSALLVLLYYGSSSPSRPG
jgi:hypothetical protein